jgi:hypothetical protein
MRNVELWNDNAYRVNRYRLRSWELWEHFACLQYVATYRMRKKTYLQSSLFNNDA